RRSTCGCYGKSRRKRGCRLSSSPTTSASSPRCVTALWSCTLADRWKLARCATFLITLRTPIRRPYSTLCPNWKNASDDCIPSRASRRCSGTSRQGVGLHHVAPILIRVARTHTRPLSLWQRVTPQIAGGWKAHGRHTAPPCPELKETLSRHQGPAVDENH